MLRWAQQWGTEEKPSWQVWQKLKWNVLQSRMQITLLMQLERKSTTWLNQQLFLKDDSKVESLINPFLSLSFLKKKMSKPWVKRSLDSTQRSSIQSSLQKWMKLNFETRSSCRMKLTSMESSKMLQTFTPQSSLKSDKFLILLYNENKGLTYQMITVLSLKHFILWE